jgi:hypothetical protein
MSLVVLVSFIYIIFFSDDCKYCCIGTGIKYLFIYLMVVLISNDLPLSPINFPGSCNLMIWPITLKF